MLIPTFYDDDVKEYWHLVDKVTLWDVAVERQVEITGPDAARFTQLLTPRDLSQTQPEQCKYVLICAPDGGIVNDPILLKLAEDHFWLSLADSDALLYALGVQAFANMDVEIREPDVSPLQIQGPLSKPLIRKLFGDAVADQRYYWHKQTELDGIPVVVSRTGWSAELGYEVYLRDVVARASTCGTRSWPPARSSSCARSHRATSAAWRPASSTTATTWTSRTTRSRSPGSSGSSSSTTTTSSSRARRSSASATKACSRSSSA